MKKNIIWSNLSVEVDEEFYNENYPEMTAEERQEDAYEVNDMWLDDERSNLNIQLDGEIIIIASLGLWNGRRQGYKMVKSGNIKDILSADGDSVEWYADKYNVRATEYHHDGTNYYEYREVKPNVNIEKLQDKIYYGEDIDRKTLNYYTKSIRSHVAKVYGW